MIRKLRRKFIRITMASVLAVLLLIIAAVNAINIYQNNRSADLLTRSILENGGVLHKGKNWGGKGKSNAQKDQSRENEKNGSEGQEEKDGEKYNDRFRNREELAFSTRYFTVTLDKSGEIVSFDLTNIASVSQEEVPAFVDSILKRGETGWYRSYRFRIGPVENGSMIVAADATSNRSSIFSVLTITLVVGLTAFFVVLILVALFSGRAIRPISETYDKQRQFITDASHELKTPLTVVAANAEILDLTYGENEWTQGIVRQTEKMRSLINRMIQMSKLDEGEQALTFEEFDLGEAVYDTAMSFQGVAGAKGLQLSVDAVPEIFINGDESAIRQTVSILTDNAVKYCDPGGEILVSLTGSGKGKALIRVKNSCSAVSSLELPRLFDRFYRGDKAHSASGSYGLGLPIARSIAELHRGRLTARDADGSAIEFLLELPRAK